MTWNPREAATFTTRASSAPTTPRLHHCRVAISPFVAAVALAVAATGCTKDDPKPIAGLLAAGAPLMMKTKDGDKPIAVGSQLMPEDRVKATGPAVLEYYGGAIRFLDDGDALEIDDAGEAKLIGANVRSALVRDGTLAFTRPAQRIIAARYHAVTFTPKTANTELQTADYLRAFFTPNGIENLQNDPLPDGPRKPLPPPPQRERVPHVHAGDQGDGAARIVVDDEYVVAESDDLATAVLLEGQVYALGRTTRLLLPDGAEATLTTADGRQLELDGPLDLQLR